MTEKDWGGRWPDFLCVGAQKAGTTWVYENMRVHPDIFVPFLKETFFFNVMRPPTEEGIPAHGEWVPSYLDERSRSVLADAVVDRAGGSEAKREFIAYVERLRSMKLGDEWYKALFGLAESGQVCGELTPDYSLLDEGGVSYVHVRMPMARVFLICRDPVERDLSQARMSVKLGHAGDLEEAVRRKHHWLRSHYVEIIRRWRAFFGDELFRVWFYDHICTRPLEVLDELSSFIGVRGGAEVWGAWDREFFRGPHMDVPEGVYGEVRARHAGTILAMAKLYPDPCEAWAARHGL